MKMNKNIYLLIGFTSIIALSCSKDKSIDKPLAPDPFKYELDAKKFLDSAQIKEDTVKMKAINNLVIQLKDSGLWAKFTAIYPMVGGTAQSTKLNLKDPRDLNEAYRLTFSGNPVFAQTGVLFPTNADYANTHLYDSTMTYNDNSISYYSRTQNKVSGYDMGCLDSKAPFNEMTIYHTSNATDYFGMYRYGYAPASTVGLFLISTSPENVFWYENGLPTHNKEDKPINQYTGYPILIGYVLNANSGGHRECSFATIGKGLSDRDVKVFYKIVSDFQLKLNRQ